MMRRLIVAFAALSVLCCHAIKGGPSHTLSKAQVESLAVEILENTPEHVHYAKGTTFSWVLFEQQDPDPIPALTTAVLDRLKEKYTVYRSRDDIPATQLVRDESGELIGYRDGFSFRFSATVLGADKVEIRYADWEGNVGASSRTISYEWTDSQWKVITRGPLLVS